MPQYTHGRLQTTQGSQFSPSTLEMLGIQLGSSVLVASHLHLHRHLSSSLEASFYKCLSWYNSIGSHTAYWGQGLLGSELFRKLKLGPYAGAANGSLRLTTFTDAYKDSFMDT